MDGYHFYVSIDNRSKLHIVFENNNKFEVIDIDEDILLSCFEIFIGYN